LIWNNRELSNMTAKQDTTLKLEDVPIKRDFRLSRESLPENIEKTFTQMEVGQSFFLVTTDDNHSNRKVSALRSRALRYQENNPDFYFSIRKESKGDDRGVRFYRISNENN
jgi:hypothetical protein